MAVSSSRGRHFEDLRIGEVITTGGRTVTESDLVSFAGLSGDFNPIHLDAQSAVNGRYGQRVVHGVLGLSMATGLLDRTGLFDGTMIAQLEINDWKFVAPIFVGATVRLELTILSKRRTSKGDSGVVVRRLRLVDQDGKTLQEGRITVLVRCRVSEPAPDEFVPGNVSVALIGAGKIGATLADYAGRAGHPVKLANSRDPESLHFALQYMPANVTAATVQDAATSSDIAFLAVPFGVIQQLEPSWFDDRIVVDVSNYYPDRDGHVPALDDDTTTSSELVAQHLTGATVVKAMNTIHWRHLLAEPALPGVDGRRAIPLAGDDEEAKSLVAQVIDGMGFDTFDVGGLADGRQLQPGTALYGPKMSVDEISELVAVG